MVIREYRDSDYDQVNKIVLDNFMHGIEKSINDDSAKPYVCTKDNEVVGFFVLTKVKNIVRGFYYYLVDYVCTDINHQGMGVGNAMIQYISCKADEDGVQYTQLTCSNKRECARHLYEKYGFNLVETNVFRRVK